MAASDNVHDESSPFLSKQAVEDDGKRVTEKPTYDAESTEGKKTKGCDLGGYGRGWTADGLPIGQGSVMGEPVAGRNQWVSGLFSCLCRSDEFRGSDAEVCVLGSVAPCVLYGSNMERLASASGTFANHCLPYSVLYLIGNSLFGWNFLAPWLSYSSRSAIRRKFNLEGNFEALHRSCGCCGSCVEDDVQREQCESAMDFGTHLFCHLCALCQEGRELRRRLPHPGFNPQPVLVMVPPEEQMMGRGA